MCRDGFKLVSLPKNSNASLGKPINSDILEFQRCHFYGKNTNRVDAGAYLSKLAARRRRWIVFYLKKILLCCFVWVKKQKTEGERGELEAYIAFCLNRERAIVVKW